MEATEVNVYFDLQVNVQWRHEETESQMALFKEQWLLLLFHPRFQNVKCYFEHLSAAPLAQSTSVSEYSLSELFMHL